MAEETPIGNDEPRGAMPLLPGDVINIPVAEQEEMTRFQRSIARFNAFPGLRSLRWLPVFAALAAVAVPGGADAAPRRAAGAYDGTWNVVFATTRGNCSSGYSVPFMVAGNRVSSAGGGRVSGSVNRSGCRRGERVGRRLEGQRRRPARRHQRRGRMARHHHRRPLQRHLAGDADLSA